MAVATLVKMRTGKYKYAVCQIEHEGRYYFKFGFNKGLMAEIKSMEGHKFHSPPNDKFQSTPAPPAVVQLARQSEVNGDPTKLWSVPITHRNLFQLEYLKGGNPYTRYDAPLLPMDFGPRLASDGKEYMPYDHQQFLTRFFVTRHYCIGAAEMGTGKTLSAILAMEYAGVSNDEVWYVAPRSVLKAIERELRFWKSKVWPRLMTYDALVKEHKVWEIEGRPKAPKFVVFDESSRIKTHTAQRSQAARNLAEYVREDWGDEGYVILLSGSPAPKAPTDWWHQCEVACPGFIKEGTWEKFRNRLGLIVQRENTTTGGIFPQLVTWKDSSDKCRICGKTKDEHEALGAESAEAIATAHDFIQEENEVAALYKRMKGLVEVKFKKDCLGLPDKIYKIIRVKPLPETLRAAKLVAKTSRTVAERLVLLRELSDGFQYVERHEGEVNCERCNGTCKTTEYFDPDDPDGDGLSTFGELPEGIEEGRYKIREITCPNCKDGKVPRFVTETQQIACPKEDALRELLDEHEDVGRLVVYAGFQGSVDRCVQIAQSEKWAILRWDGRGIYMLDANGASIKADPLTVFQDLLEQYPRVCFIGQPGAAGMGLTLTRSPTIVYYSNDFNAESRIQSEDRIHRPGMDVNRGATIVDIIHLPSDELVLENLKAKRKLQDMTLTGIDFDSYDPESPRLF